MFKFNPLKSLTLWGTVSAVGGYLFHHFDPSALGSTGAAIFQGVGTLVAVIGARNAVAKNGNGQ